MIRTIMGVLTLAYAMAYIASYKLDIQWTAASREWTIGIRANVVLLSWVTASHYEPSGVGRYFRYTDTRPGWRYYRDEQVTMPALWPPFFYDRPVPHYHMIGVVLWVPLLGMILVLLFLLRRRQSAHGTIQEPRALE